MKAISKMTDRLRHFVRNDCGGALAELAILIPFLALMLAGVSELGRLFQTYTTLSKASRVAARYLSNHSFNTAEQDKAKNLVVCGKLTACAANDRLVRGMETTNVCIETTGSPVIETVTVRIPKTAGEGCGEPFLYQPIFNIGALLHNSFTLALPISPSTTMWYKSD
jgi:Flp pilus assembly protein TadG